jgi:hypothetical protein
MRHRLRLPLVFFPVLLLACGAGARQQVLRTSLSTLDVASKGLYAWSDAEQDRIIEDTPDPNIYRVKVAQHRQMRGKVEKAITGAYAAIGLAALYDSATTYAAALDAISHALNLWGELKGAKP